MRLHYGDLADASRLQRIIREVQPDEIYNLAAQFHVRVSFDQPEYTTDIVATGTGAAKPPQDETTPFYPRSPYAVSKLAAHWFAVNFREAYGLFCQQWNSLQP